MNKSSLILQIILKDSRKQKEKGIMTGSTFIKYDLLKAKTAKELNYVWDNLK